MTPESAAPAPTTAATAGLRLVIIIAGLLLST